MLLGSALTLVAPQTALAARHKPAVASHVAVHAPAHSAAHVAFHAAAGRHVAASGHAGVHEVIARGGRGGLLRTAMAVHSVSKRSFSKHGKERLYARSYGGISCVPFARSASGIELKGNAANWWDAASGVYARGSMPEVGSVLNFRATGRMRLGHVAVVTGVVNTREVEIDHANWGGSRGGVTRGIQVIDVSDSNDWSEVRVALGHGGEFGSVYPTYGFIYDRPDNGTMLANRSARPGSRTSIDEVAEAPADQGRTVDAAAHSLR